MRRQRGIALLVTVLAVALAVVLVAALVQRGATAQARTLVSLRAEQTWQLQRGLELFAARILREDAARSGAVDHHGEPWAQPMPPIEVPGARIGGRLRDLGGCLNLNALGQEPGGELARQRLQRLLRALGQDPLLAEKLADWIDADQDPRAGGAEDAAYRQARPPHRTANRPFAHVSELRLVIGIDAAAYEALAPHVCALPADHLINLNTAAPALWMALDERIGAGMAERLARGGQARYGSIDAVGEELARLGLSQVALSGVAVGTRYFVAEAEIDADGLPFLYSSLLRRDEDATRVLARVRGTY
ncbi:MAG TPA: type II secretion system minor pseudopilin GspK [Xanthomonadaceae bacterium]|nr:type II secretion system minor pseudopilin GspK [Xanthomonadaceae bacterium]